MVDGLTRHDDTVVVVVGGGVCSVDEVAGVVTGVSVMW